MYVPWIESVGIYLNLIIKLKLTISQYTLYPLNNRTGLLMSFIVMASVG